MFSPMYKGSRLVTGNPESSTGIVTLWTKAKELAAKIDMNDYCVMGNLYSAERGLDLLVRNLLANPQIDRLVITGVDFSKSGIVLADFFEKGFYRGKTETTEKDTWRVNSQYEGYIDTDIPEQDLELLRQSISIARAPDITNFDFSGMKTPALKREKKMYEKKEEEVKKFVGEDMGHIVRGRNVAEAWLKILDTILKFGKVNGTHYDDQQKEIVNLLSIIENEDPNNLFIPDYMPADRQHVTEYIPRITKDMPGGIHKNEYTYGSRMRSWFGHDQVKAAIDKLCRESISRAVVISLWDPVKDLTIGGSPCLNHIWLRIRDSRLHMTCIFRSHDMFEGYPENAYGLRVLQEDIRKEIVSRTGMDINLGHLMILSQSAHIYDDSWERCQTIIHKYLAKSQRSMMSTFDPRGNFIISTDSGSITMEHTSPAKEVIGRYTGKTAREIMDQIIFDNVISLVPHALDIGAELQKAEIAIRMGIEYNQDNPLSLPVSPKSQEPY